MWKWRTSRRRCLRRMRISRCSSCCKALRRWRTIIRICGRRFWRCRSCRNSWRARYGSSWSWCRGGLIILRIRLRWRRWRRRKRPFRINDPAVIGCNGNVSKDCNCDEAITIRSRGRRGGFVLFKSRRGLRLESC